jgi:enoyl-CoA hydratase/carnithine racemase
LAEECAKSAPEALQLTKRMLNETVGEHLMTLLAAGAAVSATARTTEAAAEGLAAFLEKREPKWR